MLKQKLSKKVVLVLSWLIVLFAFALLSADTTLCHQNDDCLSLLSTSALYVLIFISPVAFFSLILYFLKDKIFNTWLIFTTFWTFIFLVLISVSPEHKGGGGWFIASPSPRDVMTLLGLGFYTLVSVLIILIGSIQAYRNKK